MESSIYKNYLVYFSAKAQKIEKIENFKNCLEATQLDHKIIYLGKNEIYADSLKKYHKEFIKNHKLILKTQQKLKGERYNALLKKLIRLL